MAKISKRNSHDLSKLRVALLYDRVNKWGGAERVVIALKKIFPEAPLFTSVYKKDRASWARKIDVRSSFLQKIPFSSIHHEALGAIMPIAFESFSFDDFDLVISVTSEAAKGIITKPHTRHISVILTPTRYLWSGYDDYFQSPWFKTLTFPIVSYLRYWDKIAASRPDDLIAISRTVQSRIQKYYGFSSSIAYPPLMIRNKNKKIVGRYFLVVSRLVPYKRVDIAVRAANRLKIPLKIIGTGNELAKLRNMAGPTIEFLGSVTDEELKKYYAEARALIFPGIEDFGLVMVEANAAGTPIVAFRAGGAEEIVIEGKTGEFFEKQNSNELARILKNFRPSRYNSKDCKRSVNRFSFKQFEKGIMDTVNNKNL